MTAAEPVGGRWSRAERDGRGVYPYRDADREGDLFSYHMRDSNKDGIDEVRLRHEPGAVVFKRNDGRRIVE